MGDGWDYGPGNFGELGTLSDYMSSGFSFNDALSSTSSLLGNLANVWGAVEVAKVKANTPVYSRAPNGMLYRDGLPMNQPYGSTTGGNSLLIILLIGAGVLFALKD